MLDADGIVVVMEKKITVDEYFTYPETNRPMELVYGYVREPAMPFGDHQLAVVRLLSLLDAHVRPNKLGKVCYMDVVLDREAGLVLQPDLFFVSTERLGIMRERAGSDASRSSTCKTRRANRSPAMRGFARRCCRNSARARTNASNSVSTVSHPRRPLPR